ncbi:hypothetical protein [Edaphocola flava]|uniref:hypothetical protein n=1 Tax=Edaphocola flava TaxID=2499629 RepID=UPI00100A7AE0|nr:hypothetical protein [Edaphocola flava]
MIKLMKIMSHKLVQIFAGIAFISMTSMTAEAGKGHVLIITAADNIKSNHYYDDYIAKEMGVSVDSLDYYFNGSVTRHLQSLHEGALEYTLLSENDQPAVKEDIEISGEAEGSVASVDKMSLEEYHSLLEKNHTEFLLVINQHYLKKMESGTMNTVFHIVSYTLFDKDKKQLNTSSLYYSTIKLDKPNKMESQLKKTAAKMASKLEKVVS